jgi:hypothetical protein
MSMIGSRSAWSAAVALALLATPIAGFLLLRPDQALEASTPEANDLAAPATPSPRPQQPPRPSVDRSQLAAARSIAGRFASQYAAHLGGRVAARAISDAAPELIRELDRHPPRVTPTHQQLPPSLRRLTAEPAAGTVRAVATLQDASGPPYRLSFYLERRGPRWLVTRLGDV